MVLRMLAPRQRGANLWRAANSRAANSRAATPALRAAPAAWAVQARGLAGKAGKAKDPRDNPQVFMDVAVGDAEPRRITFELRADVVPKTAENFRALCTGEVESDAEHPLCYRGSRFHRIMPDFMVQGGDITSNDGRGGMSIYTEEDGEAEGEAGLFEDENFKLKHAEAGMLSMANHGSRHTNNSQFFITLVTAPWLDRKHVVFGEVVDGMDVLHDIELAGELDGKPTQEVVIVDCGQLEL